jgi:putative hemolysin
MMDSSIAHIILFFSSLAFCALFSFLETSITALRLFKLKELAQEHGKYKDIFASLENSPTHLLNTMLVANTLASTTAATAGTFIIEDMFSTWPASLSFILSILIVTSAILVIGEIIPKNIAKMYGEKHFKSTLWLTNIFFYALYPFVTLLIQLSNKCIGLFMGPVSEEDSLMTSEPEIQFLINYIDEKGLMERDKTNMLRSIFALGKTPVKEIMVPSTAIISISSDSTITDAFELFTHHQFSRIPVYECDKNNIIGMLHFKDIIPLMTKEPKQLLKASVRPILFIPENMKVNQLLKEFKAQHMHIATVINEHGAITGLATLEDVLEEIVGEIHDEYEAITPKVVALDPSGWLVDASVNLEDLKEILKITFNAEQARTLGGFLIEQFQHLPKKGERLWYLNYTFQVQQANAKKIIQVLVFETPTEAH